MRHTWWQGVRAASGVTVRWGLSELLLLIAQVDMCVTLGGDGCVLHLASLFERDEPLPPVVSFAMGTLGFLTPFDVNSYEATLSRVCHAAHCRTSGISWRVHRHCK